MKSYHFQENGGTGGHHVKQISQTEKDKYLVKNLDS
jgi:hypothetical protein